MVEQVPKVKKVPKVNIGMDLPATDRQVRAITKLAQALHITHPIKETKRSREEARNLIYQLRGQLKEVQNGR